MFRVFKPFFVASSQANATSEGGWVCGKLGVKKNNHISAPTHLDDPTGDRQPGKKDPDTVYPPGYTPRKMSDTTQLTYVGKRHLQLIMTLKELCWHTLFHCYFLIYVKGHRSSELQA